MKMSKRLMAMLLTLLFVLGLSLPVAQAEAVQTEMVQMKAAQTEVFPETIEYVGGVIERGRLEGAKAARAATLDVAYVICSDAFLTVGEESTWTFVAEGGAAPYTYRYMMYWQEFSNTSNMYSSVWANYRTEAQTKWEPTQEGRYFLHIYVYDANGEYLVYQSSMFETAKPSDYDDENTVAGKVEQIIAENIRPGMSDYDKALVLHDWLIYNANYDYSYTYYTPDGVLLYGTGVCQSYALAYQMMLKKVGIENLYVTGMAGGGSHAWNLVKMGGEWYHVDCTWDDPGRGGGENHTYFGMTDAMIARDHIWNEKREPEEGLSDTHMPSCTATRYSYALNEADIVYSDINELTALVSALPEGMRTITFYYIGEESDVSDAFIAWLNALNSEFFGADVRSFGGTVSATSATLELTRTGNAVVVSPRALVLDIGENRTLNMEVYPSGSAVTWASSDTSVVRVNANGQVTGVGAGTATVTATMAGENKQATCTVEVLNTANAPEFIVDADGALIAYTGNAKRLHVQADEFSVIGAGAFANCTNLKGVEFYYGITAIRKDAFAGCTNLKSMVLPASIETIEDGAIPSSVKLVYVEADSTAETWAKNAGVRTLPILIEKGNRYELPVSLTTIEAQAFIDSDPTDVEIADGCVSIGEKAFAQCEELLVVSIPASVTEIAEDAFEDSLLLTIVAPQGSAAHDYAMEQGFHWSAE